jgi:hypothetical protein
MLRAAANRTSAVRHDVALRVARYEPSALPPAIEKSNCRRKRKLISVARECAAGSDLLQAGRGLVSVRRRWARVGFAGAEYEKQLVNEFARVYDGFRARVESAKARATAVGLGASVGGAVRENREKRGVEDPGRASVGGDVGAHAKDDTGSLGRFCGGDVDGSEEAGGGSKSGHPGARKVSGSRPRVGGGRVGKSGAPPKPPTPKTPVAVRDGGSREPGGGLRERRRAHRQS